MLAVRKAWIVAKCCAVDWIEDSHFEVAMSGRASGNVTLHMSERQALECVLHHHIGLKDDTSPSGRVHVASSKEPSNAERYRTHSQDASLQFATYGYSVSNRHGL
jgi:hypothetical protein